MGEEDLEDPLLGVSRLLEPSGGSGQLELSGLVLLGVAGWCGEENLVVGDTRVERLLRVPTLLQQRDDCNHLQGGGQGLGLRVSALGFRI